MLVWVLGSVGMIATLAVIIMTIDEPARDASAGPAYRSGPVGPRELRSFDGQFVRRGYDPGQVDAILERAAATMEAAGLDASGIGRPTAVVPGPGAASQPTSSAGTTLPGSGFS